MATLQDLENSIQTLLAANTALATEVQESMAALGSLARRASTNPTTRADGSPLEEGDEYFNTTSKSKRRWVSGNWVNVEDQHIANVEAAANAKIAAAEAAKVAAEVARDAAQLSAGVFADTAAGLAAGAPYFSVPSAESSEFLVLYRNNGGVAQEVKRYPSAALFTGIAENVQSLDGVTYQGSGYAWAVTDQENNIAIGVKADGTVEIGGVGDAAAAIPGGKLATEHLEPRADGSGYAFAVADEVDNLALAVLADGAVIVEGDRVALRTTQAGLVDVVYGTKTIVCWGDSLTEGAGATGGQTYPAQLAALLGASVINEGFGGQRAAQITARQGGNAALVTVSGNQIPASGSVAVTLDMNLLSYPSAATLSIYGYLHGVYGTLTKDTSDNYSFTRATAGAAVTVPPATPFIVTRSTRNTAGLRLDHAINIFWCGSNDVGNSTILDVLDHLDKCVHKLTPTADRKFLILGPIANQVYGLGTQAYTDMRAAIDAMKAKWPRNFIDIQALLVEHYNPGVAQDVADYANKVTPSSLRADGIHLNNTGYGIVAAAVKSYIDMKGWMA